LNDASGADRRRDARTRTAGRSFRAPPCPPGARDRWGGPCPRNRRCDRREPQRTCGSPRGPSGGASRIAGAGRSTTDRGRPGERSRRRRPAMPRRGPARYRPRRAAGRLG
jgi:hypothetical protein